MEFSLILALPLLLQAAPGNAPSDALAFLNAVTQRYADAKSYHIEAIVERNGSNELTPSWEKTFLKAIISPGGRYHYEGRSGYGSATLVNDGVTKRAYYTQAAAASNESGKHQVISQDEMALMEAKDLVQRIRSLSTRLRSASFLPDERLELDGRGIECRVVRFTEADFKIQRPGYKTEDKVWVDKSRNLIVKTASRSDSYIIIAGSNAHRPTLMEDTTIFPVVQLDEREPDSSFTFSPPPQAKLVASFFSPIARPFDSHMSEFVGKPAPEIHLKGDGKETLLSSYRGKPVFVEFWATSCGPCVELMPELKKLYAETTSKGVAWVSIDNDDDGSVAATFVKREQIPWPNYHDDDGTLGQAFKREAIPLGVLIDPAGKVTFCRVGYDITELRAAIAKLGPEFASVANVAGTSVTKGAAPQ